jgi:hypothetical protein
MIPSVVNRYREGIKKWRVIKYVINLYLNDWRMSRIFDFGRKQFVKLLAHPVRTGQARRGFPAR